MASASSNNPSNQPNNQNNPSNELNNQSNQTLASTDASKEVIVTSSTSVEQKLDHQGNIFAKKCKIDQSYDFSSAFDPKSDFLTRACPFTAAVSSDAPRRGRRGIEASEARPYDDFVVGTSGNDGSTTKTDDGTSSSNKKVA